MWGGGAVSDEDRLDRAETSRVLRRSLEFAQPHRRWIVAALGFVTISTMCTVAGPLLVKFATDHGLVDGSARALNGAVIAYCAVVVVNYVVGRQQFMAINIAGEGFLRDLRIRVFDCLQR
jgi:ATP-binding cassette subfamily B protein